MTVALQDLPMVDVADVYKRGVLAGELRRTPQGVTFSYSADYQARGEPAVATTLPVTDQVTLAPAGAVPPFFAGLLPEGRRLVALRRAVKTSADDDLSLLLAVGSDTVGDVQVLPVGVAPHEVAPMADFEDPAELRFDELFARVTGASPDPVGLPGVQEKVSARMISLPVARRTEHYILKLNPPESPGVVENEAFFLRAAKLSSLAAVNAEVIRDRAGQRGLLVQRFDRIATSDGREARLAVEDGCQVLGRYPADKYAVASETVCAALARVTRAPLVAARELLRQLAFAYLTCNGDAHAKNLAVVQDEAGEWRVSPAYDVPSSYPYGDTTLALSIAGRRQENVTRGAFVSFGDSLGLPERAVTRAVDEICAAVDKWIDDVDTLPYDRGRVAKLRRAINFRRRQLSA